MSSKNSNGPRGNYSRGYLPHIDSDSNTQFLTYRLADSVPKHVVNLYQEKLARNEISEVEHFRFIEKYLDKGRGGCFLALPDIASIVEENLMYFDGKKYQLHAWVIMPNHLHKMLTPFPGYSLAEIAHSCKSYTASRANSILGREGAFWFPEPYDRYIRNDKHFEQVWNYIENNPVKAGLCESSEQWRFSSAWHNFQNAVRWD